MTEPRPIDYAAPRLTPRHSIIGIAAVALALLAAAAPAAMGVFVWHARSVGQRAFAIGVSADYYTLPASAVALAAVALWRGAKRLLPAIATTLAVAAAVAVWWINERWF